MKPEVKKYLAELIGTFALVFAGTTAIVVNSQTGALGHVGVALVFGFIVAVMVYSLGHISGAHINPAVTIGLWTGKKIDTKDAVSYIFSQLIGAILASLLVLAIFGAEHGLGVTLPTNGDYVQSLLLETVLTFFLVFVVISCATDKTAYNQFAGWAIGTTVGLDALMGGPISGASMNPARSFGPALISGDFTHNWIYWIGPILGGVIAVTLYRVIQLQKED